MSWLFVTIIVSGIGFFLSVGFGFHGWALVAAIMAFASWTSGIMVYSVIIAIKSLRYEKAVIKTKGEDKFTVTLKLGPFSYAIDVKKED